MQWRKKLHQIVEQNVQDAEQLNLDVEFALRLSNVSNTHHKKEKTYEDCGT